MADLPDHILHPFPAMGHTLVSVAVEYSDIVGQRLVLPTHLQAAVVHASDSRFVDRTVQLPSTD
tara:strand:+ start:83 stop:274 length:192 start_codon:yes stop_codon:yes gene_type:complete